MDFFEYATLALQFINTQTWYVPIIVGALCFLLVFVFQGIGLFVIAGHEGYKHRWMAFVPFLNTYYISVCGDKNRVFRSVDTKIFGIITAALEALLFAGYIVYYVAQFKLLFANCIVEVPTDSYLGLQVVEYQLRNVPVELAWAAWCFECLYDYILVWFDLVFLALQIFILSAFFQTYSARRYFLFTITSALFPIQGILIFILRNNKGMNYREFMRREQERQYRMYQQYQKQNFENNPYNQNPYSRGGYGQPYDNPPQNGYGGQGSSNVGDDPFSEFGDNNGNGGNDDPFEN